MTNQLAPNWVTDYTGKDPYRPWCRIGVDGVLLKSNGYDQPWLDNDSAAAWTAETLGGAAPGEGSTEHSGNGATLALDAAGTFLANGESATYRITLYNSRLGRETAPQELTIANASGGARLVRFTWSVTGLEAWWTHYRIYRRFKDASGFKLIATVTAATATYDDDTTWAAMEAITTSWLQNARYRRTIAPILEGFAEVRERILGWTGKDNDLWYGQLPDLLTGAFRQDDFYGSEMVGAGDSYGSIQHVLEHEGRVFILKERAIYELEGDDPSNWSVRERFFACGLVARRMIVRVREFYAFLDRDGLKLWTPGGDPLMAGAAPGSNFSPLANRWKSMNFAARKLFCAAFNEDTGEIELHIAVDHSPIPNRRVVYSTNEGVFTADEPLVWATAIGVLEDGAGDRHLCRGDELTYLWDQYIGTVEGVTAGPLTGAFIAGTTVASWVFTGVAWTVGPTGPSGSPIERFTAAGVLIDANRVYEAAANLLTPLYWRSTAVAVGQTVVSGGIRYLVELPPRDGGTANHKRFLRGLFSFETETSGSATLEAQIDGGTWVTIGTMDLTLTKSQSFEIEDLGEQLGYRVQQPGSGNSCAWLIVDTQTVDAGTWGNT